MGGRRFFECLREELKAWADVVLIDSRTGVTEMGGVATQHLADVVILLCGSSLENIVNTSRMCRNFTSEEVREARGGRPLEVIVVPYALTTPTAKDMRPFWSGSSGSSNGSPKGCCATALAPPLLLPLLLSLSPPLLLPPPSSIISAS